MTKEIETYNRLQVPSQYTVDVQAPLPLCIGAGECKPASNRLLRHTQVPRYSATASGVLILSLHGASIAAATQTLLESTVPLCSQRTPGGEQCPERSCHRCW